MVAALMVSPALLQDIVSLCPHSELHVCIAYELYKHNVRLNYIGGSFTYS